MADKAKTARLFEEYLKERTTELRNEIVEENLYLVDIIIRSFLNKGVEYDDLYQVGSLALVYAVERFDPSKGFEFSSFATPTIVGEIKKYFRDKGWSVHVPRRLKELSVKIPAAQEKLFEKLSRNPTVAELAEYLKVSSETILEAMETSHAYSAYSLDRPASSADGSEETPDVYDRFTGFVDKGFESFENSELIDSVMEKLSEAEKKIFTMRFVEERTQRDIAEELGISQMTVSRIEKKISAKFRKEFNK